MLLPTAASQWKETGSCQHDLRPCKWTCWCCLHHASCTCAQSATLSAPLSSFWRAGTCSWGSQPVRSAGLRWWFACASSWSSQLPPVWPKESAGTWHSCSVCCNEAGTVLHPARRRLRTCTLRMRSCIIPSLSSSLLLSVESCSLPTRLILPRFCRRPFLLQKRSAKLLHRLHKDGGDLWVTSEGQVWPGNIICT